MKLPIPLFASSGNVFTEIEIESPKPSVIADAKKALDNEGPFSGIAIFIAGCMKSISTNEGIEITEKTDIRNIVMRMPYRSAEVIMIQGMLKYDPDYNFVEGVYTCPRCQKAVICELTKTEDYEMDNRDLINELAINNMEEIKETFEIVLTDPVQIINKVTKEILESIQSIELRHPMILDCIVADKKYGDRDEIRTQFAMYAEALVKVNGIEIDKKYRKTYGVYIFENIKNVKEDMGGLNSKISEFGIDPTVERVCSNRRCGKIWKTPINMSSFFVSGLTM